MRASDHLPRVSTDSLGPGPKDYSIMTTVGNGVALIISSISTTTSPLLVKIGLVLFFFLLGVGLLAIEYKNLGRKNFLFLAGLLLLVTIAGASISVYGIPVETKPAGYYLKVIVYDDSHEDGQYVNSEKGIPDVKVHVNAQFSPAFTTFTGSDGGAAIPLQSVERPVSIGVCGIYQTHHVTKTHDTENNPYVLQIGVSRAVAQACKQSQ